MSDAAFASVNLGSTEIVFGDIFVGDSLDNIGARDKPSYICIAETAWLEYNHLVKLVRRALSASFVLFLTCI